MGIVLHFLLFYTSFGYWANPEQTVYPPSKFGVVKNIFVGKLDCGGRLNDLTHFQTWCIKNGKVIQNQVVDLGEYTVSTIYHGDTKPGEEEAEITWLVAYVFENPQTVKYQVTYRVGDNENMLTGQF